MLTMTMGITARLYTTDDVEMRLSRTLPSAKRAKGAKHAKHRESGISDTFG